MKPLHLFLMALLPAIFIAGTITTPVRGGPPPGDGRTVIDNERGGYFMYPFAQQWDQLGADIGYNAERYKWDDMNPQAVKGIHGRLQHFMPEDEHEYSWFPVGLMRKYEADEIAQGHAPLWITTTYQGKHVSVLWSWHWQQDKQKSQAINIGDDRFIKFFINQYCRAILMDHERPGWWVGLDNAAFDYSLYGILDPQGKWIANPTWDQPFPQNNQQWMAAAQKAFDRIAELAPDVRLIANEGSMADESRYARTFQNVPGVIHENILIGEPWYRSDMVTLLARAAGPDRDKVNIFQLRVNPADADALRSGYIAYLIYRGPNAFFGPMDETCTEIDPRLYAAEKNALGRPIAPTQMSKPMAGKEAGFRSYWRETEGGVVYLNMSGVTQTYQLPEGEWYDRAGKIVTSLVIPDYRGDYATRHPGARVARPAINPRFAAPVTGPIAVTLSTLPWTSGAVIRYTLDGAEPTEQSPIYEKPLQLSASAVVQAAAFKAGMLPSFIARAEFHISSTPPKADFHLSSDDGSEFLDDYPLVELSNPSMQPISVAYRVTGGTATAGVNYLPASGALTFPPGERYRHFHLPILNAHTPGGNKTVIISLSDPTNASLGPQATFTYTILIHNAGVDAAGSHGP